MNDYRELVENVRICASGDCCGCTLHGNKINCQEVLLESAADAIEKLAKERDAEPVRHGHWSHLGGDEWCCSNCGDVIFTEGSWEAPTSKYCQNCGAKMDEVSE